VLAVLTFGAYGTARWWGPALFGEFRSSADAPPVVVAFLVGYVILSVVGGLAIGLLIAGGGSVRERHRWQQEEAERERQRVLQRQLWELERQIWEEGLPDWQREAIQESRQRQAEITREARWRLGLPEEGA
jgi:hypothetical protein